MKKSHELATLTGSQVMVLVASETGHVYTYSTPKFKPILNSQQGRKLIRTCLSDEGRNVDEDDINIDEVKVDQLEEINASDENAEYGENDDNDVSDYREDEVFKVETSQASGSQLMIQNEESRSVQMNTVVYQTSNTNQRVVQRNIEPEPPRILRVSGNPRQLQSNQYTVSSSIPVVIRGGNQRAVIQTNGMRLQKPEFVQRNYDAGGSGETGSNEDEDYDYYENGRNHQRTQNRPLQYQVNQPQRHVVFNDRPPGGGGTGSRVIQRR